MAQKGKLTETQIAELHKALKKQNPDVHALAKQFGISVAGINYHRAALRGHVPPSRRPMARSKTPKGTSLVINTPEQALAMMNEDIEKGELTLAEIAAKYGTNQSAVWSRKKAIKAAAEPEIVLTPEQCKRAVDMIKRIAEVKPKVFSEVVVSLSKKYPTLWLEVL